MLNILTYSIKQYMNYILLNRCKMIVEQASKEKTGGNNKRKGQRLSRSSSLKLIAELTRTRFPGISLGRLLVW